MIDPFPPSPVLRLSAKVVEAGVPAMPSAITAEMWDTWTAKPAMIAGTVEAGADFWTARHSPDAVEALRRGNEALRCLSDGIDAL